MAISGDEIKQAWSESFSKRMKAKQGNAPDLKDEADRSHFWTIVMHKYKATLPQPNFSGVLAFIMSDSETLEEFNSGVMASNKISDKDKLALVKEFAGYFEQAAGEWPEWKAKHG